MLNVFKTKIVVLNTVEAAQDLLGARYKDYSERPRQVMVCELYALLAHGALAIAEASGQHGMELHLRPHGLHQPKVPHFPSTFCPRV